MTDSTHAKAPDERTKPQRQIQTTNYQIDQLTSQLYNLNEEETKTMEDST